MAGDVRTAERADDISRLAAGPTASAHVASDLMIAAVETRTACARADGPAAKRKYPETSHAHHSRPRTAILRCRFAPRRRRDGSGSPARRREFARLEPA